MTPVSVLNILWSFSSRSAYCQGLLLLLCFFVFFLSLEKGKSVKWNTAYINAFFASSKRWATSSGSSTSVTPFSAPYLLRCYSFVNTVICIYCKWWRPWAGTEPGAAGSRHRARHRARHSTSRGLRYPHFNPTTLNVFSAQQSFCVFTRTKYRIVIYFCLNK